MLQCAAALWGGRPGQDERVSLAHGHRPHAARSATATVPIDAQHCQLSTIHVLFALKSLFPQSLPAIQVQQIREVHLRRRKECDILKKDPRPDLKHTLANRSPELRGVRRLFVRILNAGRTDRQGKRTGDGARAKLKSSGRARRCV